LRDLAGRIEQVVADRPNEKRVIDAELSQCTQAELESLGDLILGHNAAGHDPDGPAYSEAYLLAREIKRGVIDTATAQREMDCREGSCSDLYEIIWWEISTYAKIGKLSARQVDFLDRRRKGKTVREIAADTGWSRSTVSADLLAAIAVLEAQPYYGLWTVLCRTFRRGIWEIRRVLRK